MNTLLIRILPGVVQFFERIEGQDLVEYALSTALIGFGSVAAMSTLSNGVAHVFFSVSSTLGSYLQ